MFDRVTALDAIGPYEVLSRLPGAELTFVGFAAGPVRTDDGRLALHVDALLEDVPHPDLVCVPGGWGTRTLVRDDRLLRWIRDAHEHTTWTTSVCTGSLLLGAAGLLDGLEATTHWLELDSLVGYGARPTDRRVVEQGKVITAAGVSSGIDMALHLAAKVAGEEIAKTIQLLIEYDPQPPFDAGSAAKAPESIVNRIRGHAAAASREAREHPAPAPAAGNPRG